MRILTGVKAFRDCGGIDEVTPAYSTCDARVNTF